MKLKQIMERLAAIRSELETEGADIEALKKETDELLAQRAKLMSDEEERTKLLNRIGEGTEGRAISHVQIGGVEPTPDPEKITASPEYRSAYLKQLQGQPLTDAEQRAYTHMTTNTAAVIPDTTVNKIYSLLGEVHPIVRDVKRVNTKGTMSLIRHTEIVAGDAKAPGETVANDDEQNTFVKVQLGGKKYSKHIVLSYELMTMAIDAFEDYLVRRLPRVLRRLSRVTSSRSSRRSTRTGIAAENKISAATPGTLVVKDVLKALAALKEVGRTYIYANRADIYGSIAGMENTSRR